MDWTHVGPTLLASFMASVVECVEALTVVLAVGAVRGWRPAFIGSAAALLTLLLMVLVFGQSLSHIPLPVLRIVVGTLLLLFGLRWLRKAILRSASIMKMRDEAATYDKHAEALRGDGHPPRAESGWDAEAFSTAFRIVMLEGFEVVFIVIALGSGGQLIVPASAGAVVALVFVSLLGFLLHRPLANIPENALKFGVGVLLSAFGTFWVGEGVHLDWPGDDWAVVGLSLAYLGIAYLLVWICRTRGKRSTPVGSKSAGSAPASQPDAAVAALAKKIIALFVDDGNLALGVVAWVLIAWLGVGQLPVLMPIACALFFIGLVALLAQSSMTAVGGKSSA